MTNILDFLIPSNDPIQIFFFCLIMGSAFISILFVIIQTRIIHSAWEKRWNRNSEKHQVDLQHSSVSELYNVVETLSEKIAGIMPGMLLIVGLLGTFIGLGVALDKASIILQTTSDTTLEGMDSSMGELMKMMEGLGTKFKTSTWGIVAYIILKFLDIVIGYENRRLNWCVNKFKQETQKTKEIELKLKNEQESFWINLITKVSDNVTSAISSQSNELIYHHTLLFEKQSEEFEKIHTDNVIFLSKYENNHQESINYLNKISDDSKENTSKSKAMLDSLNHLNQRYETNSKQIINNQQAIKSDLVLTLKEIRQILSISKNTTEILQLLGENYEGKSNQIIENQNAIKSKLLTVIEVTKNTNNAMVTFTDSVAKNINSLELAVSQMSNASTGILDSSNNLKTTISSLNQDIQSLLSNVDRNLSKTINIMSSDFKQNMSSMAKQLQTATDNMSSSMTKMSSNVEKNLSTAISTMSSDFKDNMTTMAGQLESATTNISTSIKEMSNIINTTMSAVDDNMKQSTKTQRQVLEDFQLSSSTLNEQVESMTGLVKKLSNDITSGLRAVSESGQRMLSLDKRYNNIQEGLDIFVKDIAANLDKSLQSYISNIEKVNLAQEQAIKNIELPLIKFMSENSATIISQENRFNMLQTDLKSLSTKLSDYIVQINNLIQTYSANNDKAISIQQQSIGKMDAILVEFAKDMKFYTEKQTNLIQEINSNLVVNLKSNH